MWYLFVDNCTSVSAATSFLQLRLPVTHTHKIQNAKFSKVHNNFVEWLEKIFWWKFTTFLFLLSWRTWKKNQIWNISKKLVRNSGFLIPVPNSRSHNSGFGNFFSKHTIVTYLVRPEITSVQFLAKVIFTCQRYDLSPTHIFKYLL